MIDIIRFIVRFLSVLIVAWVIYLVLASIFTTGIISSLLMFVGFGTTCFIGLFVAMVILWAWDQL